MSFFKFLIIIHIEIKVKEGKPEASFVNLKRTKFIEFRKFKFYHEIVMFKFSINNTLMIIEFMIFIFKMYHTFLEIEVLRTLIRIQ